MLLLSTVASIVHLCVFNLQLNTTIACALFGLVSSNVQSVVNRQLCRVAVGCRQWLSTAISTTAISTTASLQLTANLVFLNCVDTLLCLSMLL